MIHWLALGAALALAFALPPILIGRCVGLLFQKMTKRP